MAILNDLIVTNSAKVLSTVYGDGFSMDGTLTIKPGWGNELNIYPENSSSTALYFNYRSGMNKLIVWNGAGGSGAGGTVEAGSFNATSDKRLKENIVEYNSPTAKSILNLPVYKFDFIGGQKNQIGCLAQDLQEICPELVDEDEKGYLSIKESKIVYLLLEEVKQLKKEVDELKKNK